MRPGPPVAAHRSPALAYCRRRPAGNCHPRQLPDLPVRANGTAPAAVGRPWPASHSRLAGRLAEATRSDDAGHCRARATVWLIRGKRSCRTSSCHGRASSAHENGCRTCYAARSTLWVVGDRVPSDAASPLGTLTWRLEAPATLAPVGEARTAHAVHRRILRSAAVGVTAATMDMIYERCRATPP